ncbi:bucentaur or craniofacial development-domain-containing protein [Aspergillus ambiguus]|uniref:putative Swr1p complex component (Swc5) n=1 Tax=Aspergillus ambiguus TaxID=176160 RepID=UPI003CCCE0F3
MSADLATMDDPMLEDEQYDSAEDEDFQLDDAQEDGDITSSEDENEKQPASKRRKRNAQETGLDIPELDSGDEVTIQKAKSKKQKKQSGKKSKDQNGAQDDDEADDDVDFDDEEGGPGGFVRTRAMKMRMQEERKPLAKIDGATIDVDELWARMNAPNSDSGLLPSQIETKEDHSKDEEEKAIDEPDNSQPSQNKRPPAKYAEEMIKIKRTYKFAGEMITEEKLVPKDSAEAKIFLANEQEVEAVSADDAENVANLKATVKLRRPLRKVSRFDPNPTGSIKKSWEKQQTTGAAGQEENVRGPKINTVEKSRLDWAAYVDQAGIQDELKVHSKAKEGFLGRMDFLDRVGAKREEERRNARLKGL